MIPRFFPNSRCDRAQADGKDPAAEEQAGGDELWPNIRED